MELKIKDPGSALTHFIAMLTAMVAASRKSRIRPRDDAFKGAQCVHRQYDPALRRKYGLPHLRYLGACQ